MDPIVAEPCRRDRASAPEAGGRGLPGTRPGTAPEAGAGARAREERILAAVALPLENMAFAIAAHLESHGSRLDVETRFLLAGLRDGIGELASASRAASGIDED